MGLVHWHVFGAFVRLVAMQHYLYSASFGARCAFAVGRHQYAVCRLRIYLYILPRKISSTSSNLGVGVVLRCIVFDAQVCRKSMAFPKLLLATKSWWKIRRLTLYTLAPSRPFTRRGSAHDTWRQWCMLHMFAISWHVLYILEVFAIHAGPAGADADGHRCWKACALWEADCYITDGCWGDVRSSRGDISHITSQPRIELERLGPMMTYVDYVVRCSQVLLFG